MRKEQMMKQSRQMATGGRRALRLGLGLAALVAASGCGGSPDSDILAADGGLPFGGPALKFQSTYVYFPSDFSMSIVRDTMPQDDACRILSMYARSRPPLPGLPVLPYPHEHYALIITIDGVHANNELSIDPTDRGGVADMRYAILGRFAADRNSGPLMTWPGSGAIRLGDVTQYQHAQGDFRLKFPSGEHIEQPFDVTACQ
jgi:hypothetical protein